LYEASSVLLAVLEERPSGFTHRPSRSPRQPDQVLEYSLRLRATSETGPRRLDPSALVTASSPRLSGGENKKKTPLGRFVDAEVAAGLEGGDRLRLAGAECRVMRPVDLPHKPRLVRPCSAARAISRPTLRQAARAPPSSSSRSRQEPLLESRNAGAERLWGCAPPYPLQLVEHRAGIGGLSRAAACVRSRSGRHIVSRRGPLQPAGAPRIGRRLDRRAPSGRDKTLLLALCRGLTTVTAALPDEGRPHLPHPFPAATCPFRRRSSSARARGEALGAFAGSGARGRPVRGRGRPRRPSTLLHRGESWSGPPFAPALRRGRRRGTREALGSRLLGLEAPRKTTLEATVCSPPMLEMSKPSLRTPAAPHPPNLAASQTRPRLRAPGARGAEVLVEAMWAFGRRPARSSAFSPRSGPPAPRPGARRSSAASQRAPPPDRAR